MFKHQRKSILYTLGSSLVLAIMLISPQISAAADGCDVTIDATDAMAFSTKEISVKKACKIFNITLKHVGKLGKNIMGHNLVVSKEADQKAVVEDGNKAGAVGEYVKANDARIVAHTKLLGGGEQASTQLNLSKLNTNTNYVFFCSFPGHAFMMKGVIKFV